MDIVQQPAELAGGIALDKTTNLPLAIILKTDQTVPHSNSWT